MSVTNAAVVCLLFGELILSAQSSIQPRIDKNGDYHWVYRDARGRVRQFVFVPATKINPAIRVELVRLPDGRVRYRYRLANGTLASQRVRVCLLVDVDHTTRSVATPTGWGVMGPTTSPDANLLWREESISGVHAIRPGDALSGFELESSGLPGLLVVKCGGHAPEPDFRFQLPDAIDEQVGALRGKDFISVLTIGPTVSVANNPKSLFRDVVRTFREAISSSDALNGSSIAETLDELVGPALDDPTRFPLALSKTMELLSHASDDPWTNELRAGFSMSLESAARQIPR